MSKYSHRLARLLLTLFVALSSFAQTKPTFAPNMGIRARTWENRWYYPLFVNVKDMDSLHICEVAAEGPPT